MSRSNRRFLLIGLVAAFAVALVLHQRQPGEEARSGGQEDEKIPSVPRELTAEQRRIIDKLVGRRISEVRQRIVKETNLEANIRDLTRRKKEWQAWQPAAKIGWCARKCRSNHVPVPEIINEAVVEDIIWQYENAYGTSPSDVKYHREECARALGFIGHPKGVPTILTSLEREGGHFSWQALEGISDGRFIEAINRHLDFTNQQDAFPAIASLGRLGEAAIQTLLRFVEGDDRALRRGAIEALIRIGTPQCLSVLRKIDASDDAELAAKVAAGVLRIRCRAIDNIYQPPVLTEEDESRLYYLSSLVFPHLKEESSKEAEEILLSIGPAAFPTLRSALSSSAHADTFQGPVYFVSERAADLLTRVGESAIPCLIDGVTDEAGHTREFAAEALRKITGEDSGPDYDAWSGWFLGQERRKESVSSSAER